MTFDGWLNTSCYTLNLLKTAWAMWALFSFALLSIAGTPLYFLIFSVGHKNAPHVAHFISRMWARVYLTLILVRVKTKDKSNLRRDQPYVFITNHQSLLDIPICAVATDNTFRFLGKAELAKIPLIGYIASKLYLLVKRDSKEDRAQSIQNMKKSLADGISVFIYPEGTRKRGEAILKKFYDGAFKLAIETGVPLAILTIDHSAKLLPADTLQLSPGFISTYWEKPIETLNMRMEDISKLKKKSWGLIYDRLKGAES